MKFALIRVIFLIPIFLPVFAKTQSNADDSSAFQTAVANTISIYYNQLGDQSGLYNGRLYARYDFPFAVGSPYFLSSDFNDGSIIYSGVLYTHVPILFDELREQVVTRDHGYGLQLVNERISEFSLLGHRIIRVVGDSLNENSLATGFYDLLYSGKSSVLRKSRENMQEKLTNTEILRIIVTHEDYLIRIGVNYQKVNSKRELLDIMSDHRKQIQQFIKKNRLHYRRDTANTLIKTAAFYDQLSK